MELMKLIEETSVRFRKGGGFRPTSKNAHKPIVVFDYGTGERRPITGIRFNLNEILIVTGSRKRRRVNHRPKGRLGYEKI